MLPDRLRHHRKAVAGRATRAGAGQRDHPLGRGSAGGLRAPVDGGRGQSTPGSYANACSPQRAQRALFLAEDIDKLEQAIRDLGEVRMVCIDPITSYMGSGKRFNSHRATDVRSQLHPLACLAERCPHTAFALITHPAKNASARAALDAFIGSQAFIAAARVGHYLFEEMGEPEDDGSRAPTGRILYSTPKHTNSAEPPILAYRIEWNVKIGFDAEVGEDIMSARVVWEPELINMRSEEARLANIPKAVDGRKMRTVSAKAFLRGILAGGPVEQKTVIESGAEFDLSYEQLYYALKKGGIGDTFQPKDGGSHPGHYWALKKDLPEDGEAAR